MGADLYLRSLWDVEQKRWRPRFEAAIEKRDESAEGTADRTKAQREAERCFEKMSERGYFRDSYNSWNVLWRFGLSWWEDITPLLDGGDLLVPEEAQGLLNLIAGRSTEFEASLESCSEEEKRFFERKRRELVAFLEQAIHLREPIECSL